MTSPFKKCPSGKFRYTSLDAANSQLKLLRDRAARGDTRRREQAAYECSDCGGAHLTSKPRPPARSIESILADNRPQRGALHPYALDDEEQDEIEPGDHRYDDVLPGVSHDFP